ncbi:hypothetical protein QFZ34_002211 [Phyllobacterium ifriqiyense]|uniref:Nucleotidyltransferase n=1 Tax=Phyllobacterium ifriqiyense TaxID=314238 RepID=A0ABU0S8G3_9HYPH|nr:hypothetical protein [Phyllobacterium ifriqiyense]MDQ0997029.1 hypothetical protein [Phyllobacterium ifriqiyense]
MAEPKPLSSIADLLFNAPLYAKFTVATGSKALAVLYDKTKDDRIDGFCKECRKDSTFVVHGARIGDHPFSDIDARVAYDDIYIECSRDRNHVFRYNILISKLVLQKVGQFPPLAEIAIEETRQKYKSVLKGDNWSELYKAIGLAAHGEGIGSFVYLRRVFERLIQSRFDEYRVTEGWADEQFKVRMEDKIDLLKAHLPEFLVENRRIYGIFSQGIHELENDVCLQFFDVGKESIIMILEEDLRHKEKLDLKSKYSSLIAQFDGSPKVGT